MTRAAGAREVARRVLARVEGGGYATLALDGELRRGGLSEADRALATELVYGVLRWRLRLDRVLDAMATRGLSCDARTLDALRLGAYQILRTRVPAHAAVDDAVEAVRRLRGAGQAGFVNALLRRLARSGEPSPPTTSSDEERLSWTYSVPPWIVREVRAALGDVAIEGALGAALAAFNEAAPVWLRANALRTQRDELAATLRAERPRADLHVSSLAPAALAVVRGGELFTTQAAARGEFVAQDLGAQLVALLLDPRPGELLLDACAGVGGKSTHLAELTANHATIDAADLSARKLELCRDTAHRLGTTGIRCVAADLTDTAAPLRPAYDRVLLDAPCSGLGVLRRHPELKWRRTVDDVRELAALQARLLAALAPRVRPGGLLVYSVCTFTAAEGPEQVRAFLSAHPDFHLEPVPTDDEHFRAWSDLRDATGALRTWPHRDGADAFYAVRLRRVG